MQGSKYKDEKREEVIALIAAGMSCTAAAKKAGVPKSTASHWWNTQAEADEDVIAARMEARRRSIQKCGKIVDRALGAIDRKVTDASREVRTLRQGLDIISRAAKDGALALGESDAKALRAIVSDYTGVGLREMSATMGDICKLQESLERQVSGMDGEAANTVEVKISVVGGAADGGAA